LEHSHIVTSTDTYIATYALHLRPHNLTGINKVHYLRARF